MPPPTQADIRRVVEKVPARVQALLGADESHDDRHVNDDDRPLFASGGAAICAQLSASGHPNAMNMRIRPLPPLLPIGTAHPWATACMPKYGWTPTTRGAWKSWHATFHVLPSAPSVFASLRRPPWLCARTAVVGWHEHGRVCTAGFPAETGDMGAATRHVGSYRAIRPSSSMSLTGNAPKTVQSRRQPIVKRTEWPPCAQSPALHPFWRIARRRLCAIPGPSWPLRPPDPNGRLQNG